MMPHIVPNSAIPIHPKLIKPLQFVAGPADESLVNALKDFMKEVECIGGLEDDFDEANLRDIDELGQIIIKDLVSGEITGGDGYYGWSRSFCQKMKRRKASKGLPDPAGEQEMIALTEALVFGNGKDMVTRKVAVAGAEVVEVKVVQPLSLTLSSHITDDALR
jgi:hypothetical protein